MRVDKFRSLEPGTQIQVVATAPSSATFPAGESDDERLAGQVGRVVRLANPLTEYAQLWVDWETDRPGSLMLSGRDEITLEVRR